MGFDINNTQIEVFNSIFSTHWIESVPNNLLIIFVTVVVTVIGVELYDKYLKYQNSKLESIFNIRTGELLYAVKALQNSEQKLAKQIHIQSRLASSISHDVNTPLRFIKKMFGKTVEVLKNEDSVELTESIDSSLSAAMKALEHLTAYIRTQARESAIKVEDVNLKALLSHKISFFENDIRQNKTSIVIDLPDELCVRSRPKLLSIVLHHILDNAINHSRQAEIRVFCETDHAGFHLVIADSGAGMPPDVVAWANTYVKRDPLQDFQKISEKYAGSGLIIAKEMCVILNIRLFVEVHNGTIVHLIFQD